MSTTAAEVAAHVAFIRPLPLFAGLDEADLQRIASMARRVHVSAGSVLFEEGTPGDGLYIVIEGEMEVSRREGAVDLVLAVRGPGEFVGEQSLLEQTPRSATVRAIQSCELLVIDPVEFQKLLASCPSATLTILRTVMARLRSTEGTLMQREKLAGLGTLAAGLAHELNNPAAAIGRAAEHLREVMAQWLDASARVSTLALTPAQAERLRLLKLEAGTCVATSADPLACSYEEDAITEWLEDRGVEQAWEIAPPLVAFGWRRADVARLTDEYDDAQLAAIVPWIAGQLAARALLDEVGRSAHAISDIVRAVKSYAYLDQAPVQEVDLRESLDNTLVILRHRLRQGIEVMRDYDADLPLIEAHGSELNQVWTNIIGNAIDALEGHGTITLRTRRSNEQVVIEIIDDGPGIPAENLAHIFDPFFTTKPPGVGTGLGLHIAYNIIVNRHRGRIRVESEPGRTHFEIILPLRLHRAAP